MHIGSYYLSFFSLFKSNFNSTASMLEGHFGGSKGHFGGQFCKHPAPGSPVLLLVGKDNMIANWLETFVAGEHVSISPIPPLNKLDGDGNNSSCNCLLSP